MSDTPQATLRERIRTFGIVPVIAIPAEEVAVPLAEAPAGAEPSGAPRHGASVTR